MKSTKVEVRTSLNPTAGKGLFAKKRIKEGSVVAELHGKFMVEDDFDKLEQKHKGYGVGWSPNVALQKKYCDLINYNTADKRVSLELLEFWVHFGLNNGANELETADGLFNLNDVLDYNFVPEVILTSRLIWLDENDDPVDMMQMIAAVDCEEDEELLQDSEIDEYDAESFSDEIDEELSEEIWSDEIDELDDNIVSDNNDDDESIPNVDGLPLVVDTKNVDSLGKYVNDPRNDPLGRTVNVVMIQNGFVIQFVALRTIEAGEEILGEYGEDYWNIYTE